MKRNSGWKILIGTPKDFEDREKVTKRCLEIANKAKFPTDYDDMYEHLFANEKSELFMILNEYDEIYGFATCDNIVEYSNTYLHGIIIHPEVQEKGFSLKLIEEMIKKDGNTFFSARTHNPRIYELMASVACNNSSIFPHISSNEIPKEIWNIVYSHPAMKYADSELIVRNAYPDEKVMQAVKNKDIERFFKKLNPTDAQVIVVRTKSI